MDCADADALVHARKQTEIHREENHDIFGAAEVAVWDTPPQAAGDKVT